MMRYAAYGSNLHPLRLGERTPTARCLGTSRLDGWSLHFHKRGLDASAKCNILPGGAGVHVAVYEMASGCKQILDAIEGVGRGYRCEMIDIPKFGPCFIYLAENTHIDLSLLPYDWYGELVVLGCELQEFPTEYAARVRSMASMPDPNLQRRRANWKIVEKIRRGAGIVDPVA